MYEKKRRKKENEKVRVRDLTGTVNFISVWVQLSTEGASTHRYYFAVPLSSSP